MTSVSLTSRKTDGRDGDGQGVAAQVDRTGHGELAVGEGGEAGRQGELAGVEDHARPVAVRDDQVADEHAADGDDAGEGGAVEDGRREADRERQRHAALDARRYGPAFAGDRRGQEDGEVDPGVPRERVRRRRHQDGGGDGDDGDICCHR